MSYTVTFGRNNLRVDVRNLPKMKCNECHDFALSSECYTAAITALAADKSWGRDTLKLHQSAVAAGAQPEYSDLDSGDGSDEEVLFNPRENNDCAERSRRRRPNLEVNEQERDNQHSFLGRLRARNLPSGQSRKAQPLSCETLIEKLFLITQEKDSLTAPIANPLSNMVMYYGIFSGALNISLIAFITLGITVPALAISSSYLFVAATVMIISNQVLGMQCYHSRAAKLVWNSLFGGAFNLLAVTAKQTEAKKAIKDATDKIQNLLNEVENSWGAQQATLFKQFSIQSDNPHINHVENCLRAYERIFAGNTH